MAERSGEQASPRVHARFPLFRAFLGSHITLQLEQALIKQSWPPRVDTSPRGEDKSLRQKVLDWEAPKLILLSDCQ